MLLSQLLSIWTQICTDFHGYFKWNLSGKL